MRSSEYTQLKLAAIVLPEPVISFVLGQQNFIEDTWGLRYALRTPPHLTLIEPIALSQPQIVTIQNVCSTYAAMHHPFHIRMSGYGAFEPRVIYIEPDLPQELLEIHLSLRNTLQALMPEVLKKYMDRKFHPHITLAHRDVSPSQFNMIRNHYQNLSLDLEIQIDRFHILGHRPEGWVIENEFIFNLHKLIK